MKKFLKVIGIILAVIILAVAGLASYVKLALPNVGPAPVMHVESTPERVARGQYLATNVMLCMDCHGTRNWNEYAGPVVPGTLGRGGDVFDHRVGFPGTFYARNITPAGIGNWTDGEIFRTITTGVDRNGKAIFPVMPYHLFGQGDEEDIKSVIAFLRTLPPVENKVPESVADFPMNFIINTIPKKANLHPKPSENDSLAYGKYMMTIAACQACHTPVVNGQPIDSLFMAGGREFNLPSNTVTSANITQDMKTGIGTWTREIFLGKFAAYRDSSVAHRSVSPTEDQTVMPWSMYAHMSDRDLGYIYEYLKTITPKSHAVVKFKPPVKQGS